jgi:hypothetical protein
VRALAEHQIATEAYCDAMTADAAVFSRFADTLTLTLLDGLAGGDLRATGERSKAVVTQALELGLSMALVVDHLFATLIADLSDAVVEQEDALLDKPQFLQQKPEN